MANPLENEKFNLNSSSTHNNYRSDKFTNEKEFIDRDGRPQQNVNQTSFADNRQPKNQEISSMGKDNIHRDESNNQYFPSSNTNNPMKHNDQLVNTQQARNNKQRTIIQQGLSQ